jgi:DNA-directed RNA polymerase subunit beta
MDVSPAQIVSVAASLMPFLEHDDANRALMGANMQRQAVPTLRPEKPLVGTGIERVVAVDSGTVVRRSRGGVVDYVDANRIVVRVERRRDRGRRSRRRHLQPHQVPRVRTRTPTSTSVRSSSAATRVARGDVVADGAVHRPGRARARPEHAGRVHALERLQLRGLDPHQRARRAPKTATPRSTSRSWSVIARDTKLGSEEITRDIPNVGEQQLDTPGRVGHRLHRRGGASPATSWWARSRPRARPQLTPEEKLLRAIFGEKAVDVKDTSLRVPTRASTARSSTCRCSPARASSATSAPSRSIDDELKRFRMDLNDQLRIVEDDAFDRIEKHAGRQGRQRRPAEAGQGQPRSTRPTWPTSSKYHWFDIRPADEDAAEPAREHQERLRPDSATASTLAFEEKRKKLTQGDELPPGVLKMVQGLPGREAPPAARRQDGRPPRQQGRDLQDRPGRGHAVHGRRHAGATSCSTRWACRRA